MKKYVWLAGLLVIAAFLFPRGLPIAPIVPAPAPVTPDVKPVGPTDAKIVSLLVNAPAADKAHVAGIYTGLISVVSRDAGKRIRTTEQWAELQARALQMATDGTQLKGKYPGLDVAIEAVFDSQLGASKEVVTVDAATRDKILSACNIIVESTR